MFGAILAPSVSPIRHFERGEGPGEEVDKTLTAELVHDERKRILVGSLVVQILQWGPL